MPAEMCNLILSSICKCPILAMRVWSDLTSTCSVEESAGYCMAIRAVIKTCDGEYTVLYMYKHAQYGLVKFRTF